MIYKQKYNPQIHHRKSIRLKGYDYSEIGYYFITICCHDMACLFGEIVNGEMIMNEYGQIAHNEWLKTIEKRNNVDLHEFVIMPNHFHAIIRILGLGELHSPKNMMDNRLIENDSPKNEMDGNHLIEKNSSKIIDANNQTSIYNQKGEFNSPLRGTSNTVGAIVRGYKSSVTKQLNLLNIGSTIWQRNYYEHIICDDQSYKTITVYIKNNPTKWSEDKFYAK